MAPPAQLPSGTVTLLFTDIEGSTLLWEAEREPMAAALRRHDEILRACIEDAGGYVFKTVGDAFCAAFGRAESAVAAAAAAQRALGEQDWPTSRPIRVRMGLHTGACEERDGDYFGPVVNRAARLEAVAHGGQVLLSGATAELVQGALPAGTSLRSLGPHRLKDLGRPEQVCQLEADFLAASFPPLASLDNPELPNNLPSLLSAFVGRERELAEVGKLVRAARLVTLTGAGGSGKTRLALQAAAELLDGSADGVWLAELAPATSGEQIPAVVAAALGLPAESAAAPGAVVTVLARQDLVLLLDNCEHLIEAAAKFCDEVIRHCPRVRILATSREPLGIDGERVYRVPSLSLPDADAESAADLAGSDAVALFADRARAHDPGFALDRQNAALAATICRRLDGIPLALELAAARLSSMTLRQVSERLDQRFRLLTGGSRNVMPRQQTLQATVDWSFGLLTPSERDTLLRLSVFAGGFDLAAAEALGTTDTVDALDVLDLIGSLVDKSLVAADHAGDSIRYRLLETIRQYAAQELLRAGDADQVLAIRDRHAEYFLALAQQAAPELSRRGMRGWFQRFDAEWDNVRAAFAQFEAADRPDDVIRLAVALERYVVSRGHLEALSYLRRALDRPGAQPSVLLARGLLAAANMGQLFLRTYRTELAAATRYAERGLAQAEELGDRDTRMRALAMLGGCVYAQQDYAASHRLAEQAVAIARELGDVQQLGEHLSLLAATAPTAAEQRRLRLEVLECCGESGDELLAAVQHHHLSGLDLDAGRLDEASAHLERAVAIAEDLSAALILYFACTDLAILRLIQGRQAEAAEVVGGCLLAARRRFPGLDASEIVLGAACRAAWLGDYATAARLHGAADTALDASLELGTISWSPAEQEVRERAQAELRELMGEAAYQAGRQAGTELSVAQAIELALGAGPRG